MDQTTQDELLRKYPYHLPVKVAAQYLGVSPRRLTKLIAEGRKPFSLIGADIGATQTYVRVYTGPLIRFLNGELTGE